MNHINAEKNWQISNEIDIEKPYLWDTRYKNEGHIWGDKLSPTAKRLIELVKPESKVFEVGYGYGRDLIPLSDIYQMHGIDKSNEGYKKTIRRLRAKAQSIKGVLKGDFNTATNLPRQTVDAVISHRTLHLLTEENDARSFPAQMPKILKPGGILCISARDKRDFNSKEMIEHGNGVVSYKKRPTHLIRAWDEAMFEEYFGEYCDIKSFEQSSEIESQKNPKPSYVTIMTAKLKNHPQPQHQPTHSRAPLGHSNDHPQPQKH